MSGVFKILVCDQGEEWRDRITRVMLGHESDIEGQLKPYSVANIDIAKQVFNEAAQTGQPYSAVFTFNGASGDQGLRWVEELMRGGTPAILMTRGPQKWVAQEKGLPCIDKTESSEDTSLIIAAFQQACDTAPTYAQNHSRWPRLRRLLDWRLF